MSHLNICRVCLCGNVKILSILKTPLQEFYERLTSYSLSTDDAKPAGICYVCCWHLQGYYRFMDKSQKSEEILTQLLESGIEILQNTVAILNKSIEYDFCISPIEAFNCPKTKDEVNVKVEIEEMNTAVKKKDVEEKFKTGEAPCRVCLAGNIKTFTIKNTPLQLMYEKLANTKLIVAGRPDKVCYICHCLLLKCRKLVNKSRKSEKILTELLRNGIPLTQHTISILNSRMKPNFVSCILESTSYSDDLNEEVMDTLMALNEDTSKKNATDILNDSETKIFECGVCKLKCTYQSQFVNHIKLHNLERKFPCGMCSYRYRSPRMLLEHKVNVHNVIVKCDKCKITFKRFKKYKKHMLIHYKENTCDVCNRIYKNKKILSGHIELKHPGVKYPCARCDMSFPRELWMREHVLRTHAGLHPHYICDICNKKFADKAHIRKHMMGKHTKQIEYKCEVCGRVFSRLTSLKNHMHLHGRIRHQCDKCPKSYTTKTNLLIHLKNHTGLRPYICDTCNLTFTNKYALNSHKKRHLNIRFTCDVCDKQFYLKSALAEHMYFHMTGLRKTYKCDKCDKIFHKKQVWHSHRYQHKKPQRKPEKRECEVCKYSFLNLKTHMRTHTGEKPYKCEICDSSFAQSTGLKLHLLRHTGKVPCTVCGKKFSGKYLKDHMLSHAGAKTRICKLCGKAFYSSNQLSGHMIRHRQRLHFQCDICGRKYNEKRALDCHKTSHTRIKKYICDVCYHVYTDKSDFLSHFRSHSGKFKFICECDKSFKKLHLLSQHKKDHNGGVCPICKHVSKCNLMRHYKMKHKGATPYACNVCEQGFGHLYQAHSHFLSTHCGKTPYKCNVCGKGFTRNRGLRRHIFRKYHVKPCWVVLARI